MLVIITGHSEFQLLDNFAVDEQRKRLNEEDFGTKEGQNIVDKNGLSNIKDSLTVTKRIK